MRTPILTLGLIIFLSSCEFQKQYVTVASDDTKTNENMEFVSETDSLRITYNFSGDNGAVQISIYNKLNEGLMVDWRKSALVIGDSPIVYYSPALRINGSIKTSIFQPDPTESRSSIMAVVKGDEAREFIPPQSKILQTGYYVTRQGVNIDSLDLAEEKIQKFGITKKVREGNFDKTNSPLVFRSYITFITGKDETGIFMVSNSFYISQLIQVRSPDGDLGTSINRDKTKGNQFVVY